MLRSLRIRNFRNLVDLKIGQLGRVNLFTGRNNSGKTTLLEAVYLMLGFGHPIAAPQINAFRGLDDDLGMSPIVVQDIAWRPMFYNLDTSGEIILSAEHSSLGSLELTVSLGQPTTIELKTAQSSLPPGASVSLKDLLFLFRRDGEPLVSNYLHVAPDKMQFNRLDASPPFSTVFLSTRSGGVQGDAEWFGKLQVRKQADTVVDALKIVEPRLQNLEANPASGTPMLWGDIGLSELVPLPVMGEGMTRAARLMLAICATPGGVVLIDEIETGLHHSILPKVWQSVDAAAKNFDTQVIATTHSYECLEAACQALGAEDFRLHRLEAGKGKTFEERKIRCVTYEPDEIHAAIHHNFEVR